MDHFKVSEDTKDFYGDVVIKESYFEPGMILIETQVFSKENAKCSSSGIRLTREQAREMAGYLNSLADHLFFESMRG